MAPIPQRGNSGAGPHRKPTAWQDVVRSAPRRLRALVAGTSLGVARARGGARYRDAASVFAGRDAPGPGAIGVSLVCDRRVPWRVVPLNDRPTVRPSVGQVKVSCYGRGLDLPSGRAAGPRTFCFYAHAVSRLPAERALDEPLRRLDRAWRDQSAPIGDNVAPGATARQLEVVEARLGYALPPELRAWWSWHDGVLSGQARNGGSQSRIGPGSWHFLSSAEAVSERDDRREQSSAASDADDSWDGGWRREWLPFLTFDAYALFVDCRQVTPAGTAPVRRYSHTPEDVFTPDTGSLYQAVQMWTYLLEERYWYWSREIESWEDRWAEIPWPLRGLV